MWLRNGTKGAEIQDGTIESGAICKLKGLDYKQLEGFPYFPYDLVAEDEKFKMDYESIV